MTTLSGAVIRIFQSTLPVWGATAHTIDVPYEARISIHAPRVGSDMRHGNPCWHAYDFNPRSPCGERRTAVSADGGEQVFQSTLPVWGATGCGALQPQERPISIHAPRVGSDKMCLRLGCHPTNFNPRSPCGERQVSFYSIYTRQKFQSTLPVWGATCYEKAA